MPSLANTRLELAADIPTVAEAGATGAVGCPCGSALWVSKDTPKQVIAKLNAAAMDAMADPAVRMRLQDLGLDIPPREQQTPAALGALSQGRDRKVVAHHQGGKHQGRLTRSGSKVLRISSILEIGNAQ